MVETLRRETSTSNSVKHIEKQGGREVGSSPPGSEGNAIRTGSRVVGTVNNVCHEINIRPRAEGSVHLLAVPFKKLLAVTARDRWPFVPHLDQKTLAIADLSVGPWAGTSSGEILRGPRTGLELGTFSAIARRTLGALDW